MRGLSGTASEGFVPPPYPYDRLDVLRTLAERHVGGMVDLSVGTPCDPPPSEVVAALASSGSERGYPPAKGTTAYVASARAWLARRFDVHVPAGAVAACIGTKEFVATLPQWLKLRRPLRDTVLYPAIAYPTYAMGATLAQCRAVPVPTTSRGTMDLASLDPSDVERALVLWVNSPANPTGVLEDLDSVAAWGRDHGVVVAGDECYAEFTWNGAPRSILQTGFEGVVALHSLSKRSNLAGVRAGFYAGDPELVGYLSEVRKHAGLMVPGPVQAAACLAWDDDVHVAAQRHTYRQRLEFMAGVLTGAGYPVGLPEGAFYLWVSHSESHPAEAGGWALADELARRGGVLVSPGDFYGPGGHRYVRVAMVAPMPRLELVANRLARTH